QRSTYHGYTPLHTDHPTGTGETIAGAQSTTRSSPCPFALRPTPPPCRLTTLGFGPSPQFSHTSPRRRLFRLRLAARNHVATASNPLSHASLPPPPPLATPLRYTPQSPSPPPPPPCSTRARGRRLSPRTSPPPPPTPTARKSRRYEADADGNQVDDDDAAEGDGSGDVEGDGGGDAGGSGDGDAEDDGRCGGRRVVTQRR
ncbi:hypothetical protein EDB85DRAFT_2289262, partial [Lactarius pseudohatsudake]